MTPGNHRVDDRFRLRPSCPRPVPGRARRHGRRDAPVDLGHRVRPLVTFARSRARARHLARLERRRPFRRNAGAAGTRCQARRRGERIGAPAAFGDRRCASGLSPRRRLRLCPGLPARPRSHANADREAAGSLIATQPIATLRPSVAIAGCDPALALLAGPLERHRPPTSLMWWSCNNTAGHAAARGRNGARGGCPPARRRTTRRARTTTKSSALQAGTKDLSYLRATPDRCARSRTRSRPVFVSSTASRAQKRAGCSTRRSEKLGTEPATLAGYDTACSAHLLVASSIAAGLGDIGVASEPAAFAYGLGFVPWQEEICELRHPALAARHPGDPRPLGRARRRRAPRPTGGDRRLRHRPLRQGFSRRSLHDMAAKTT